METTHDFGSRISFEAKRLLDGVLVDAVELARTAAVEAIEPEEMRRFPVGTCFTHTAIFMGC